MAFRCDVGALGQVQRTPAGGIKVPATVARSTVLQYPWGREYVPKATLEASISQLAGLPVSLNHPPERRVDSANWSRRGAGHAGEDARMVGDAQEVTVYVQREDAVAAVDKGTHRQISMGYEVELDNTPGTTADGQRFDSVQTERTYNHIALVRSARGGSTLAVRLDSNGDAVLEDDGPASAGKETLGMKRKVRIDGVDHEVEAPEAFFQALDRSDSTRAEELKTERARADSAEGERDTLKTKLTDAEKRLDEASDPARLDERVKARTELEQRARGALGDKVEFTGKTDREVMEMVIRTDEKDDLSALSDDYVRGAFTASTREDAAPRTPRREDSLDRVRRAANQPRQDGKLSLIEEARQRRIREDAEAYKRPLSVTKGGVR